MGASQRTVLICDIGSNLTAITTTECDSTCETNVYDINHGRIIEPDFVLKYNSSVTLNGKLVSDSLCLNS